jgi:hypothetical protein
MKCNTPKLTQEQKDWLDEKLERFNCVFVGFHGSHLYGLDRECSDIDVKAIYLPTKTDLILGESVKTHNYKNDELDIEVEVKSLSSFIKSAKSCDTNCVDLLHCPPEMVINKQPLWDNITQYSNCIFAKNMKGIIGYIKTHSKKYTNKIDRLNEMQKVLKLCGSVDYDLKPMYGTIKDLAESASWKEFKYVKPVTLVQDHEQQYLDICGKKYIYTWSIDQLEAAMVNEINRYGKRTNDGQTKGMDTKSLSHALRVLYELEEILTTGTIKFPLKDKDFVLRAKLGQVSYEEVMDAIDTKYEVCMELLDKSNLPEHNDLGEMYKVVEDYYFN